VHLSCSVTQCVAAEYDSGALWLHLCFEYFLEKYFWQSDAHNSFRLQTYINSFWTKSPQPMGRLCPPAKKKDGRNERKNGIHSFRVQFRKS